MNPSDSWKKVVTAMSIGSDQAAGVDLTPPKGIVLKGEEKDKDRSLLVLETAASWSSLPEVANPVLADLEAKEPSPEETKKYGKVVPLKRFFEETHGKRQDVYIVDYSTVMQKEGLIAPPDLLPFLLSLPLMHGKRHLEEYIRPLLGERAKWLAKHNEAWQWVLAEAKEITENIIENWEEATTELRHRMIQDIHQGDSALAHQLLDDVFKEESASNRLKFLNEIEPSLSAKDVAFLKRHHDDRSAQVRYTITLYLARLDDKDILKELTDLLESCQKAVEKPVAKWDMAPSKEIEKESKHLGIGGSGLVFSSSAGKKARAMMELIVLLPLSVWESRFKVKPLKLLQGLKKSEFFENIHEALLKNLVLHRNKEWAEMILESQVSSRKSDYYDFSEIIRAFPSTIQMELFQKALPQLTKKNQAGLISHMLDGVDPPWTLEFTLALFEYIKPKKTLRKYKKMNYDESESLEIFCRFAHLDCYEKVTKLLDAFAASDMAQPRHQESIQVLHNRHQLMKEISHE